METKFLRLFSIVTLFTVTDFLSLDELKNCSLTFGKLPTIKVEPIKYDVSLTIMPHIKMIHGTTDIIINVKETTTNISLHARDLDINSQCTVIMKPDEPPGCFEELIAYKLWKLAYCPENEILLLIFLDYIPVGVHTLHIEHTTLFNESLYKINYPYSWTGNEKRWLVTNLYNLNSIRGLFPCWDDPSITAYFEIVIKHETIFTVFSNKPVRYELYDKNDMQQTHFIVIRPTSISFLAFVIVRGIIKDRQQHNINYLWHRQIADSLFEYAHVITHQITLHFEFDMKIILSNEIPKIDHVAIPKSPMKSAGKPGLIIYRESDIVFNETANFVSRHVVVAKLAAYEEARQLFLSYIDMYLNHKWINEMLASFYSFYILDKIWIGTKAMELFVVQNLQTALDSDIYLELEPIIHKSKDDSGIDGLLYPLLYHKKAFVLMRMLFHLLTRRSFHSAMQKYIHSPNIDFWTVCEEEYFRRDSDKYTIKEIMESWLTEKHHAEMHFYRDYEKKIVEYNATCGDKVSKFKIPFTYITRSSMGSYDTANVIWYEGNGTKVISDLDSYHFFLVNVEQIGYYRVNYDTRNWLLLSAHLQHASRPIPVLNRAQIVNDAFYFTTTKKMESSLFFDVLKFLKHEVDYIVWYPMFNILSYMSNYLESPLSAVTQKNFLYYLDGLLRNVGFEKHQNENNMIITLRLLAIRWSCHLNHTQCRNNMTEKFIAYMYKSKSNTILQWPYWMYCIGMMNVNLTIWETIMQYAIEQKDMQMFEYLPCSEDVSIILNYMDLILYTNMEKKANINMAQEYLLVVKKHVRKDAVLDFVLENYNIALIRYRDDFVSGILMEYIILNVYSNQQLDKIYKRCGELFDETEPQWDVFQILIERRRKQIKSMLNKFEMFSSDTLKISI